MANELVSLCISGNTEKRIFQLWEGEGSNGKSTLIDIIKEINIYHPYGVVGTLPWAGQSGVVEFGSEPQSKLILELSQVSLTVKTPLRESEGVELIVKSC